MLEDFIRILGEPEKRPDRRGWATWFCPFHADNKHPNFGANINTGAWKCLACGRSGGSPASLAKQLGIDYRPNGSRSRISLCNDEKVSLLGVDEAIEICRSRVGYARSFLEKRGLSMKSARMFGLGYGINIDYRDVSLETIVNARNKNMMDDNGVWLWENSVVYAEPPGEKAVFVQVRYIKPNGKKYRTWGVIDRPAGAWLVNVVDFKTIVLVEGLFDMLVMNQMFLEKKIPAVALSVMGASVPGRIREFIRQLNAKNIIVVPDNDEAGEAMASTIESIASNVLVRYPPAGKDPDEAVLGGWNPLAV